MIKKCHPSDTRKIYDFYTYDLTGKAVVITIRAHNADEAWDCFEALYTSYVDQVIVRK